LSKIPPAKGAGAGGRESVLLLIIGDVSGIRKRAFAPERDVSAEPALWRKWEEI
jgi:hypothetical protein